MSHDFRRNDWVRIVSGRDAGTEGVVGYTTWDSRDMNIPNQQYVTERTAELQDAAANSDGDAAVTVLERISGEYPEYAQELTKQIIAEGLIAEGQR